MGNTHDTHGLTIAVKALGLAMPATSAAQNRSGVSGPDGEGCRVDNTFVEVPELCEGSGLALGSDGRLWSHNDSATVLVRGGGPAVRWGEVTGLGRRRAPARLGLMAA